jgi:hypothetical protein
MPYDSKFAQKFRFTKPTASDLYNRFYALFGFILTISIHVACHKTLSPHSDTFDALLGCAIGVVPLWGVVYGAWMGRLTWAWCLLNLFSISSLIDMGFHLLGQPEMFVCFAFAQAICIAWLIMTGAKLRMYPNQ